MTHLLSDEIMGIIEYDIAARDPFNYIANVKRHFADSPKVLPTRYERDANDFFAYSRLDEIQFCLANGRTTQCLNCRRMEGEHSFHGNFCATDAGQPRTTFLSMEMTYNSALGGFPDVNSQAAYRMGE